MLHGFNERFPTCVLLWPVRVQGEGSAAEVAAAIRGFNALQAGGKIPRPDVLIVARGGGSLEDLWSFNEEIVVRAAAESRIPLISGRRTRDGLDALDLVADARAPTPTKAAEWAVPKYSELIDTLDKLHAAQTNSRATRCSKASARILKASSRGLPKLAGSRCTAATAFRCDRPAICRGRFWPIPAPMQPASPASADV